MAATKVVVDPITRIEGHLRIEAQAENGRISNAWASSTQFRGIEIIMQGRDPRDAWAFTQRICGVCTVVHAVASCRAVEDALGIEIPPNANLIRNLVHVYAGALAHEADGDQRAQAIVALCVGGMVLARTTDDAALRGSLRAAARTQALALLDAL